APAPAAAPPSAAATHPWTASASTASPRIAIRVVFTSHLPARDARRALPVVALRACKSGAPGRRATGLARRRASGRRGDAAAARPERAGVRGRRAGDAARRRLRPAAGAAGTERARDGDRARGRDRRRDRGDERAVPPGARGVARGGAARARRAGLGLDVARGG